MENQAVRRRMSMIAGHFAGNDDVSPTFTHIFPLNCSSSLNYVIRRCDNRMYFGRQSSDSQACFMRQVSTDQSGVPPKSTGSANDGFSYTSEAPLFSRPSVVEPNFANVGVPHPVVQDCESPEPPKFARPNRRLRGLKQICSNKKIQSSESNGFEWSPRMDVAESGRSYVVTVELPGVGVDDVRVEVNDKILIVTGKRSTQWWKKGKNDSISAYHKREIFQGPYQVVWPLPINANRDCISAEFVDGFLRITIPKL